jgi:hypothetical protein
MSPIGNFINQLKIFSLSHMTIKRSDMIFNNQMQHNSAPIAHILGFRLKKHLEAFYIENPEKETKAINLVHLLNNELSTQLRKIISFEETTKFKAIIEYKEIEEKRMIAKLKEEKIKEERRKELENFMAINSIISDYKHPNTKERDCEIIQPLEQIGKLETELNDVKMISSDTIEMLSKKNEELQKINTCLYKENEELKKEIEAKNLNALNLQDNLNKVSVEKLHIEKERNFLKKEYFNLLKRCRRLKLRLYK